MPNAYRTTDQVHAVRIEDQHTVRLTLQNMTLFASGAFSNVYSGVAHTDSNHQLDIVIKKTWPRRKDVHPMEVEILKKLGKLKHRNVVSLLYSYSTEHQDRNCLALVFEFVPLNLHQYLKENKRQLDIVEVKLLTWQLFRGQAHIQKLSIVHRDIKPQNLLFNAENGLLKISDFGSSTMQSPRTPQPSYHVTRYYRPPELVLGSKLYGCEVDIWSCGCVFGELLKGSIFLAGRSATNQAEVIFDLLGLPTAEDISSMKVNSQKCKEIVGLYVPDQKRKGFEYLYQQSAENQKDRKTAVYNNKINLKDMKESAELLSKILIYTPAQRLAGMDLLVNPYFSCLFNQKTSRWNGGTIKCLQDEDVALVRSGDKTVTNGTTEDGP